MYNNICEYCGAHLDPNERCDCKEQKSFYKDKKKTTPINKVEVT